MDACAGARPRPPPFCAYDIHTPVHSLGIYPRLDYKWLADNVDAVQADANRRKTDVDIRLVVDYHAKIVEKEYEIRQVCTLPCPESAIHICRSTCNT